MMVWRMMVWPKTAFAERSKATIVGLLGVDTKRAHTTREQHASRDMPHRSTRSRRRVLRDSAEPVGDGLEFCNGTAG